MQNHLLKNSKISECLYIKPKSEKFTNFTGQSFDVFSGITNLD